MVKLYSISRKEYTGSEYKNFAHLAESMTNNKRGAFEVHQFSCGIIVKKADLADLCRLQDEQERLRRQLEQRHDLNQCINITRQRIKIMKELMAD